MRKLLQRFDTISTNLNKKQLLELSHEVNMEALHRLVNCLQHKLELDLDNLSHAIQNRNRREANLHCSQLKTTCNTLGAEKLSYIFDTLEGLCVSSDLEEINSIIFHLEQEIKIIHKELDHFMDEEFKLK